MYKMEDRRLGQALESLFLMIFLATLLQEDRCVVTGFLS